MDPHPVVGTFAEMLARIPDLRGVWAAGLDLRAVDIDWASVDVTEAAFGGCQFADGVEVMLRNAGAIVLAPIDSIGCSPYRTELYTNAELMQGYERGRPETTLDARIGARCVADPTPIMTLARGIHDACVDGALQRFVTSLDAPIVGVMGGHAVGRGDPVYREVADLGRRLTRAGFVVATGGGPGLMEAANLGAWLATAPDPALDDAVDQLAAAPRYDLDAAAFLERALDVRSRWPDGATSLGVPTWLYVDEPLNQFATWIAKYFQNSIRENGLLAISLGGVVYAPGGSGTAQEIFTDAAQNDYTLYGTRSPMVLLGTDHDEHEAVLVAALRDIAERGGWGDLVSVASGPAAAVAALQAHTAPRMGAPPRPLRKR